MASPLGAVAQRKIRVWREIDDDEWISDSRLVTINSSGMYWDAQTAGWISYVGSDSLYAYFQDTRTGRQNRKMKIDDYFSILTAGRITEPPTPAKRYRSLADRLREARKSLASGSENHDYTDGVDDMLHEALKIVGDR